jgi:hypothetical protein
MQYGFVIPGGDVNELAELSVEIEAAGWDGLFIADGVYGRIRGLHRLQSPREPTGCGSGRS